MDATRAGGGGRIPAVLCIDVEPDLRRVEVPSPPEWRGFAALLGRVDALRAALEARSGAPARLGWFLRMDPQVEVAHGDPRWVARRHGDDLARLAEAGDDIGLHPHSWRWTADGWLSDQGDPAWVRHCADVSFDAYEDAFGTRCRAYRHGDRFTSDDLQRHIAARGVTVDLTVEPGLPATPGLAPDEPTTGTIPAIPAAVSGICRSAVADLVLVPLTTAPVLGPDGDPCLPSDTLTLWTTPRLFAARLAARLQDPAVEHLAFAVRSEAALDPLWWPVIEANLDHVGSVMGDRIEWVAATSLAGRADGSGPRWPETVDRPSVVRGYGAAVERSLREAELELAAVQADRDRLVGDRARLEVEVAAAASRADRLQEEHRRVAAELAELRSTRTWRLHQRLLPVLRLLLALARLLLRPGRGRRG